jgi:hypothetical protein
MVNIFAIMISGITNTVFELYKKQKDGMVHSERNRKVNAKK